MIRSLLQRVSANEEYRGLATQGGVLYVAGAVSVGLTLVQQLLTARYLGASDFGRYASTLGVVLLTALVVDVRTWELGTRLLAKPLDDGEHDEAARRFTWLVGAELVTGAAGALLVCLIAPVVVGTVLDDDLLGVLLVLSLVIPLRQVALGVGVAVLRMQGRFHWISARSVATAVVRVVAIAGPAAAGWGVAAVAVGAVVAELVGALSMVALAAWSFQRRAGRPAFSRERPSCVHEALRIGRQLWVSATIKGLHVESFIPVAAAFTTPEQVGTLRASLDVANMTTHATTPLGMVLGPRIVLYSHARRAAELDRYLAMTRKVLLAVVAPLVVLGVPAVLFVLPAVLGGGFASVRASAALLLVGFGASALALWVRYVLVGFDRVGDQNRLGLVAGLVSIAALPPLVSQWGAIGAAVDMTVFLVVYSALSARLASGVIDGNR